MNALSSITWLLLALATIAAGTGLLMWCGDVLGRAQSKHQAPHSTAT